MRRIYILLCALIATACSAPEQEASNGRIKIVATTGMVADLARNIGGDRVEVIGLMGPGVDPHYYKAFQGDLARITDADIVL
ncbi:MAG: zinc ABC transporter solute-binding protein, partial [Gemmatimonadetes bacterium]|nr:zinc ABC transporter solute-binding protein [Gemmatimonadota bacterium]